MKEVKTFRIVCENSEWLKSEAKRLDRSEGWILNKAIEKLKEEENKDGKRKGN